jgi:hypothetical protein
VKAQIEAAIWNVVGKMATVYLFIVLALLVVDRFTSIGKDDSDPVDGRSGMRILTDHKTGCQYMYAQRGGLTPRIARDGLPICVTP